MDENSELDSDSSEEQPDYDDDYIDNNNKRVSHDSDIEMDDVEIDHRQSDVNNQTCGQASSYRYRSFAIKDILNYDDQVDISRVVLEDEEDEDAEDEDVEDEDEDEDEDYAKALMVDLDNLDSGAPKPSEC